MSQQQQVYKPVNWLFLTQIMCGQNLPVELSMSENSGRIKMSFGRFDDGKYGFTHEALKALLFNDAAILRVREYLTQVEDHSNEIKAAKKERNEIEKQQAKLVRNQAKAAETLRALTPEQIAEIAKGMGLAVTAKAE